jgi:large subunit ribosomal protein L19e
MNLSRKKELAAKTLGVGKNKIKFNQEGLSEIKEAITKQDIKDLNVEGIIAIKPSVGRKKVKKRKTRRGPGKIKKKVNKRKQTYVKITRKLRDYVKQLKEKEIIDRELYIELRKKIRMRTFRSKANLKDYLTGTRELELAPEKIKKTKKTEVKK